MYTPTPKQLLFHQSPATYVLYGGAAGGGKSHALRWDAYMACFSRPNIRALLLRRTYPELMNTHLEEVIKDSAQFGATYVKVDHKLRFPNGSVLEFGHCQDDAAVGKYLSTQYDRIYFDELVTFSERQYLMIASRARSAQKGVRPRILAATNPGGPGAHWIKRRWIDRNITTDEDPTYYPANYAYIPATLDDNPYVDEFYESKLMALPEELREAYRYGNWDIFPGQYFTLWRERKHVEFPPTLPENTVYYRSVDWGYTAPGVCIWFAQIPDGRIWAIDEWVFMRLVVKDVATEIVRRTTDLLGPRRIRYTTGDPAMWAKDSHSGESTEETFRRNGVPMLKANHDRVIGWQRCQHWLKDAPDDQPWFKVSPACAYGIRTIPAMTMDTHRPEDVDSDGDDHWVDAMRYFFMSRPMPGQAKSAAPPPPGSFGFWRDWKTGRRKMGSNAVRIHA